MKKAIVISSGILVVIAIILTTILITRSLSGTTSPHSSPSASPKAVMACDVLTESIAQSLLGDDTIKNTTASTSAQTSDLAISSCLYTTKPDPSGASPLYGISLMLYTAKTPTGASKNQSTFSNKPSNAQAIHGFGDQAFYTPQYKQLHILKNGNWYVITSYKDVITNGSLEADKALAQKLRFQ